MEYFIGTIVACALSIPFAHFRSKTVEQKLKGLEEKLELTIKEDKDRFEKIEGTVNVIDREVPKKMVGIIQPVAVAVKELQSTIGVQ